MILTHNTDSIKHTERLEYWESIISNNYVKIRCEPGSEKNNIVDASLSKHKIGDIIFNDHKINVPMKYSRSEQDIHYDQNQYLQFLLLLNGHGEILQDTRRAILNSGDMILYDSSKPFFLDYSANHRALNIKFPKNLINTNLGNVSPFIAKTLKSDSTMGKLTASMVREYAALPDLESIPSELKLSSALIDIISTALSVEFEADNYVPDSKKRAKLERIKHSILTHLCEPELNATAIAEMNYMTTRTLNRLFATEGTTAIKWLWEQRLEGAYKMLTEKQVERVSDVAIHFGFSDFSHFSRAFKNQFGITPKGILTNKYNLK